MPASPLPAAADPRRIHCLIAASDYRDLLRYELAVRTARNIGYSLRAFARDLNVSPSTLSELFNGKHDLSLRTARTVSDLLGLVEDERSVFLDLVALAHADSEDARSMILVRLETRRERLGALAGASLGPLEASASDWRELVVMAFLEGPVKPVSMAEIMQRLGWQERETMMLLDRMVAIGFLRRENHRLQRAEHATAVDGTSTTLAYSALAKMQTAIDGSNPQSAEMCRTTAIAIPEDKLSEVQSLIASLHEKLRAMSRGPVDDQHAVILLASQYLRVDRKL